MNIIYMGTPDFAVAPLEALCDAGYDIALVVTKPDRQKDRGKKLQSCQVKLEALKRGLCVATPETIKGNNEFLEKVKKIEPQLIVVAAYGKILPIEFLEIPKIGCINIHGSLLPKYRGAAPIHHAVIDGCQETGVTLMYMAEGMDTGDIIAKAKTPIGNKTTQMLYQELSLIGADLLIKELPSILNGTAPRLPQSQSEASQAPMVFKEDGYIDFSSTPNKVCALIRGMNSWPCASTLYNGQRMKIYWAEPEESNYNEQKGKILAADKNGIIVSCGEGCVIIKQIQMPGKKIMEVSDYLLGNKIEIGAILG